MRIVRINAHLAEISGDTVEAFVGRRIEDALPALAPQLVPLYRAVLETGTAIFDHEIHGTMPGEPERPRDWLVNYVPIIADSGDVLGLLGAVLEND